jgi:hypothetical protein
MKTKIFGGIAVLAIAAVATWNVSVNISSERDKLSEISLANVEALAQEGGNARDCPGGYCSWRDSWGNSCTACCPGGKNPACNSYSCSCN